MNKNIFQQHLQRATKTAIDLTRQHCFNQLADQYRYILQPDSASAQLIPACTKQLMTAAEIVEMLHQDGYVPFWINMRVVEAGTAQTVIQLICSRRLRTNENLVHHPSAPPFHVLVTLPPDYEKGVLFDVNWKLQWACRLKEGRVSHTYHSFRVLVKKVAVRLSTLRWTSRLSTDGSSVKKVA